MSKFKKKFGRRILAYLLSGAMIMSSMTSSNMTAFASETSGDSGGKYSYEETSEVDDTEEKAEADEVLRTEDSSLEEKEDAKVSSEKTAETTVKETEVKGNEETSETETSDEEQASETESSFGTKKEEMESSLSETEEDEKSVEEYDNKEDPTADADGFYNGLELTDADMEKPYYIDFTNSTDFGSIAGVAMNKGLFSFDAGQSNAASYNTDGHGVAFKDGNQLTLKTAGKSYIVVAGNTNSSDNNTLTVTNKDGTETIGEKVQKVTTGNPTLADGKVRGTNTLVYEYTGDAGSVILKPTGTTYVRFVCVIPRKDGDDTKWDFKNDTTSSYTIQNKSGTYKGLTVDAASGKFYVRSKSDGGNPDLALNAGTIIQIPLAGKSKVKVVGYDAGSLAKIKVDDKDVVAEDATKTYSENDTYTFTCNGAKGYAKLTVASNTYLYAITVEPFKTVNVSGSITATPVIDSQYQIVFVDKEDSSTRIEEDVTNNSYSAQLYVGSAYTVKLSDDKYNITEPANGEISIAESDIDKTLNITAEKMDLKSVSGTLTLPEGKSFDIKFISEDKTDTRQAEIKEDGTYNVNLKKGTTYNIVAEGDRVKDYKISPEQIVTDNTDTAVEGKDITILEADTYAVTLEIRGTDVDGKNIDETTLKDVGAKLVFENTEDNDYKYTFKIGDTSNPIKLREGEYTVKIADGGAYIFKSSVPNLNIGNAENNLNIEFEYATSWDFVTEASKDSDFPQKSSTPYNYKGLSIKFAETQTGGKGLKFYSSKYSYIEIPVKNHCKITFSTDGSENMPIKIGEEEISALEGTTKTYQYVCNGTEGSVKITMDQDLSQSGNNAAYLKDIHVTYAKKINIADSITNGTVTFKDTANQSAISGDTVKLSDIVTATPNEKAEFSAWTVTDKDGNNVLVENNGTTNASFVMPESDVTISAEFTKLGDKHAISIAADIQYGTVEQVTGDGSITEAAANAKVDLAFVATATPEENYALSKWEVTYQGANGQEQKINVPKNAEGKYIFTMPDSDVTVKPVFARQYQITAAGSVENGSVTKKSQEPQYAFQGDIILLKDIVEATPANEYAFQAWKITYHDQSGIEATVSVTKNEDGDDVFTMPDSNVIISAVFEAVVENNFKVWLDDLADENGTVAAEAHSYQGGIVTLIGQGNTQFTKFSSAANVERDGETHNGYKAGSRHATANDIPSIPKAGDGCCVVFEAKAAGMFKMYFWSTSFLRVWDFNTESGSRNGYKDSETAADFYAFDVVPGHTYVMSTTGATNNMAYIGYQFIQNVDIEAEVTLNRVDVAESALETLKLTLTDTALGTEKAVVTKDTETIRLLKNHTYKITSNDGGVKAEVDGKDTFTVTSSDGITFDLYNVSDVTLTGEITGTAADTVTSLKFVNMVNDSEFEAAITGTTYSCVMKPGEYDTVVETTNGGKTYDRVSVKTGVENVNEVYVEVPDPSKARVYAPADIVELEQTGPKLTLRDDNGGDVIGKDGAKIKVPVTGKASVAIETYYKASYTVNGKTYTNTSGSTNSNQSDKMMVEGDFDIEVTGETYFRKISVSPVTSFKSELNVPGDYDTLNEAFDAIASMENRPEGEEGRVTVNLNKDIREQTVLRAPYVTLKGNNHTIDWYYGVGTLYYSVDPSTGLYSERLARDRYSSAEGNGQLWGGAFLVYGDHFIAEDTTFKNTYNYELTNEEKTDIAGSTLSVSRLAADADVAASAYKERSNAFYIGADQIECYNCKILSSQDTLGLNGTAGREYHVYFKDCVIGGNVDYVCGDFAAVFDNCELQWKTLSDKGNDKVGYIVAPKTKPYVFRNCKVTVDKNVEGVSGYYGRTWGDGSNASFINTETNGYIKTDGWGEMSEGQGATAIFKEYGNTSGGAPFASTGKFCSAANQTSEAVQEYIDTDMVSITETVLGGWKPGHYSYEPNRKGPENPDNPDDPNNPDDPKVKITFMNGEEVFFEDEVSNNVYDLSKVDISKLIAPTGKKFVGWGTTADSIEIIETTRQIEVPSTGITLYALFVDENANIFKVNFESYDGVELNTVTVLENATITFGESDNERDKFIFVGWKIKGGDEKVYKVGETYQVTGDITFVEVWEAKPLEKYTVTLVDENGKEIKKETVEEGTEFTLPDTATKKEGFIFAGWQSDEDGQAYSVGSKYKITRNVTFKETWVQDSTTGDTEESKITADKPDTPDGKISIRNASKIKIETANLVENTGKVQYAVTVTYTYKDEDGKTYQQQLTEGLHYDVAPVKGFDAKSVGTQKINIIGTDRETDLGTFTNTKTVSYEIKGKVAAKQDKAHDIAKKKFTLDKDDVKDAIYEGTYITPKVVDNDKVGEENYSVVYKNNVNVGKASVTITGKGEYYGSKTLTFSIKKADISKQTVAIEASNATFGAPAASKTRTAQEIAKGDLDYKGNAVTFNNLKVKLGDVTLSPRADYTVTYKKNAQAGTATATIKGANNLSGAINISYQIGLVDIKDALAACNTDEKALSAEYSSKGARLTSITLNGVTLQENKDYKVNYKNCAKADTLTVGTTIETVKVTGAGSYKNQFKDVEVRIKVEQGRYHAKDGAVVDKAKLKGDTTKDNKTIISAAKITDAAGVKIKPEAAAQIECTNNTVKITPADTTNYKETTLSVHVAKKLGSVKPTDKKAKIADRKFDGVNPVTLTETEIIKSGVLSGVEAKDIRIVSYKNNNKVGSATVTVEGRSTSGFYGTKSLKFKIVSEKAKLKDESGEEVPDTPDSTGTEPGTEEPGTEPGTEEPGTEPSTEEPSTEPSTEPEKPTEAQEHTLWLVGDSTVSEFNDNYYYPRYGYGTQIGNYQTGYYEVKNLAMSGRSSKSYLTDKDSKPLYEQLTAGIGAGDVLIIGFGHNDEKAETERYTNPNGDYNTDNSFAKSLYDNYVKIAIDAGATPILCTPIVRRNPSGTLSDADCHITKDAVGYPGGDYAKAIRDLGTEKNITVVDLTEYTKNLYTELGADGTLKLHAWLSNKEGSVDNTHLNIYGAKKIAYHISKAIQEKNIEGVSSHFWTGAEPTEADLVSNPEYKEPEYTAPADDALSALCESYMIGDVAFKGTAFGDLGGAPSKDNHILETDANGNMHIQVKNNKGKIAGTTDGIAMYYYKVPAGSRIELSAKAVLNGIDTTSSQTAFGLMARDDMWIDLNSKDIKSDYVAAGSLGTGCNCFFRQSGALGGKAALTNPLEIGKTYDLKIESSGDGYACTFGTETTQTGGYDFQLLSVDSEYFYVGMFAARNADVTFSNIKLVIDGVTIADTTTDTPGGDDPVEDEPIENITVEYNHDDLAAYNMEGFAASAGVTGGGTGLKEGDEGYYKVSNEKEFLEALKKARTRSSLVTSDGPNGPSVIEITAAELKLGNKENPDLGIISAGSGTYSGVIRAYDELTEYYPLMHPTLKETGVSWIKLNSFENMTIFSSNTNGTTIKHAGIVCEEKCKNIIFRNLTFDELWEWDDIANKKGEYGSYDRNDWDYISIDKESEGIWIDHCTFYKSYDGVIDIKNGKNNQRVTISWCQFLPASENETFFNEQMTWLENNKDSTTYYKKLRDEENMSAEEVRMYAYGQKKTHLFGYDDKDTTAEVIKVTLANNYYKDSMDRLPRLRRGTVHEYNCVLDSSKLYKYDSNGSKKITSNGALSTCNGEMLLENCYIDGIRRPLMSGNGSSPRGYIKAVNSVWYLGGEDKTEELNPANYANGQTTPLVTNATKFKRDLPYTDYRRYRAEELKNILAGETGGAGAGSITMTAQQWMQTQYTSTSTQN